MANRSIYGWTFWIDRGKLEMVTSLPHIPTKIAKIDRDIRASAN